MMRPWRRLIGGRHPTGARGEPYAARWLRRRGYQILMRNFTLGDDEADLVALDPDGVTVVIVEVKTRRSDEPPPEEQIDGRKRFRLARLAARLQRSGEYEGRPFRFDAVAIVWPDPGRPVVRHYVGAFDSPF